MHLFPNANGLDGSLSQSYVMTFPNTWVWVVPSDTDYGHPIKT